MTNKDGATEWNTATKGVGLVICLASPEAGKARPVGWETGRDLACWTTGWRGKAKSELEVKSIVHEESSF